jgi:putative addiction module component (TIGR02574 family)
MSTDAITAAALALSPEAKAKLAEQLLESFDPPAQTEIDAAWAEEAERRIDAFDRGEDRTIAADQALRDARARL